MKKTRPAKRIPIHTGDDRITTAWLNDKPMTPEQEARFEQLSDIWTWLKEMPKTSVRKKVMDEWGVKRSQAYGLIQDAENYFGDISETNKEAQRLKQLYWLEQIITNPSTKDADKNRAINTHAEITGTKIMAEMAREPLPLPLVIFYTKDPEVLREDPEEVEYEDVT